MQPAVPHIIREDIFLLSADKTIFWEQQKTLVLSDLHFGKTGHFRKSGIAVPQAVFKDDIQRFVCLLQHYKPENMIVIGDMFHSHNNKEHELFVKWRNDFSQLSIQLVMGNHDILLEEWYRNAGIETMSKRLDVNDFSFVHDITDVEPNGSRYYFSGHVHPGISISGLGRQSLRLPCFYFAKAFAVLPAFGKFTGTHTIKPKRGETVYAVMPANNQQQQPAGIIKVF